LWGETVTFCADAPAGPAYMGQAAFGKTRQGPLCPRVRSQRGRPLQPRRAVSDYDVPSEDWIRIAVPALVGADVFESVQTQLEENRGIHLRRDTL
jgi:site-specific DNA recombinase